MSRKSLHEKVACPSADDAVPSHPVVAEGWRQSLEVIGAELFQRYRKRLMTPGIALQIRRDFPGLPLLDVMLRVHAGRRILQDGDDFRALAAIRSGRWQCHRAAPGQTRVEQWAVGDRVSRGLVRLGGLLFVGFCALSLIAVVPGEAGGAALTWSVLAFVLGISVWWRRTSHGARRGRISHLLRGRATRSTAGMRAACQRDAVSSA